MQLTHAAATITSCCLLQGNADARFAVDGAPKNRNHGLRPCSLDVVCCVPRGCAAQAEYPKSQGDILALAACVMASESYKQRLASANRESKRKQCVGNAAVPRGRSACVARYANLTLHPHPTWHDRAAAAAEQRMRSKLP